jgi:hypothetical protein
MSATTCKLHMQHKTFSGTRVHWMSDQMRKSNAMGATSSGGASFVETKCPGRGSPTGTRLSLSPSFSPFFVASALASSFAFARLRTFQIATTRRVSERRWLTVTWRAATCAAVLGVMTAWASALVAKGRTDDSSKRHGRTMTSATRMKGKTRTATHTE